MKTLLKSVLTVCAALFALWLASSVWMGVSGGYFSRHSDDATLMRRLPEYQQLLAMYEKDRAGTDATPRDLFNQERIDAERWSSYLATYHRLGIVGEPRIDTDGSVWFTSSVRSMGTAGSMKGLVFKPGSRGPMYDSLDKEPQDLAPDVNALRHIEGDWFIFYRYNR